MSAMPPMLQFLNGSDPAAQVLRRWIEEELHRSLEEVDAIRVVTEPLPGSLASIQHTYSVEFSDGIHMEKVEIQG